MARIARQHKVNRSEKSWADQYLEERGVRIDFAETNLVQRRTEHIVFQKKHPITGASMNSSRTRHKNPLRDPNTGKLIKFTQRRGAEAFPYFPVHWDWKDIFADPTNDIYIVESESSALAGAQPGLIAIAAGGCDGVFMVGTHRQKLHPIFTEMKLKGRHVYIVFDGDSEGNDSVHKAQQAAAKLFAEAVR